MKGQQQQMGEKATMEAAEESTTDLAILASAASVALSWYQFFGRGNKMQGLFIGLWPPTILAFASYFNQKRMEEKLSAMGPGRIVSSIEQMLSSR
ncbi:hypothetical protein [Halorussus aquaticus]|uniref:Uncharacterized protein n=1 Tax=Halorussus aquaticus TaxID=2953748 RepID=A0ABD5PY05_9EURY|nr:hypothetical protein [Halorussus aquaticus]